MSRLRVIQFRDLPEADAPPGFAACMWTIIAQMNTASTIHLFSLTAGGLQPLTLPEMASLDQITRQLPDGFYSTFRTFDGGQRVLGLRRHIERLYGPARVLGIHAPVEPARLRQLLAEALSHLKGEARIRLILSLGGNVYAALEPFAPLPDLVYTRGVRVVTAQLHRETPRLKATAFIAVSQAERDHIVQAGAFETLMVHNGFILEGLTSNFFYVQQGRLGTARTGILPGVTRRAVLGLARRRGVEVMYRPLPLEAIPAIGESFLTSSSRGMVPIIQIDEVSVGEGGVGLLTRELWEAYEAYVQRRAERIVPE